MTTNNKERTEEEIKANTALRKMDIDIFTTDKTLEPFALGEYNIKMRSQQMQTLLRQDVTSNFFKGCILLQIKQRENLQTLQTFLEDSCGGMSQRSAYYYMTYAKKCIELKKLKEFGEKNWSKLIALMHSCSDEELKEIEKNGIKGKALSEFDGYSVLDFKRELKKWKTEGEKTVKEETRNISLQLNHALEENKNLKALVVDSKLPEGFDTLFKFVERKTDEIFVAASKLKFEDAYGDEKTGETGRIRVLYKERLMIMHNKFVGCIKRLQDSVGIDLDL